MIYTFLPGAISCLHTQKKRTTCLFSRQNVYNMVSDAWSGFVSCCCWHAVLLVYVFLFFFTLARFIYFFIFYDLHRSDSNKELEASSRIASAKTFSYAKE